MIQPRYYQQEAVNAVFDYFTHKSGNPLVALPTATGKSVVIALFTATALHYYPRTRIGIFTHVKELIQQNFNKLREVWPYAPAGIYSAGLGRKEGNKQVLFGGIQTVANAIEQLGWFDLIIIDEAHLVSPEEETRYMQVIAHCLRVNPKLKVWGATATWWRKKHGALTNEGIFTDICYDRTKPDDFRRFIAEGFLSPLIAKATATKLDTSEVGLSNGDFNMKQLEAAVDQQSITHAALRELCMSAEGRRAWLIFCSGIAHAEHVAETLNSWGIRTGVVHSKMGSAQRDQVLRDWYGGHLRCVTNNNVLTTGIDYPAIDLIGMLRPTLSSSLWVQMLGRGMRVSPGKPNCLVLDFAGNTARLGPVDDPEIPGRPKPGGGGDAPVKICPVCSTYNYTSARYCSYCATEFEREEQIMGHASDKPLMSQELPIIEMFNVTSVTYNDHLSRAENRTLRVAYHCGIRTFYEHVMIGGTGFALHNAKNWWMMRSPNEMPDNIDDALNLASTLRTPTRIRVWVNTKFPTITEVIWY